MFGRMDVRPAGSFGTQTLTRREEQVAKLASEGLANKAIATQLCLTEGTVKIHLHNIYQKLRISNRAGLILFRSSQSPTWADEPSALAIPQGIDAEIAEA